MKVGYEPDKVVLHGMLSEGAYQSLNNIYRYCKNLILGDTNNRLSLSSAALTAVRAVALQDKAGTLALINDRAVLFTAQAWIRSLIDAVTTTVALTATTTYYTPIYINRAQTIDALGAKSGSTFAGTATVRLALYSHNEATGKPSTVLQDAGIATSFTTTNQTQQQTFTGIVLQPGIYWVACNTVSAATTNTFVGAPSGSAVTNLLLGALSTTLDGNNVLGYTESVDVTSGFATAGTLTASTSVGYVFARVQ